MKEKQFEEIIKLLKEIHTELKNNRKRLKPVTRVKQFR